MPTTAYHFRHADTGALALEWQDALQDEPCYIVGNGWSLDVAAMPLLENRFTIGLNRAHKIIDPTILLWLDAQIWNEGRFDILRLKALKVSPREKRHVKGFVRMKIADEVTAALPISGELRGYKQSALYAFEVAYWLGCNPIILLGCDCCYRPSDNQTSFFGNNPFHHERTLPRCVESLEAIQRMAALAGRDVISCSRNSVFPHKDLSKVLKQYPQGVGRNEYLSRLGFQIRGAKKPSLK